MDGGEFQEARWTTAGSWLFPDWIFIALVWKREVCVLRDGKVDRKYSKIQL